VIDLESLKIENRKFKATLLLSYVLFATLILGAIYLLHVKYSASESIKNLQEEIAKEASYKQTFFDNFFQTNVDTIKAISMNELFIDFIKKDKDNGKSINSIFKTIMQSHKNYMQLRYIDKFGQEIIRFDRKEIGDKPIFIKKDNLQNKSQRYYYKESMRINQDKTWFSKIDLNVEHGKIDTPIKPVLRLSHQVHIDGKLEGFVILNIFMKKKLEFLTHSSIFDIFLVDEDGFFISHINKINNWSRYFNKNNITKDLHIKDTYLQMEGNIFNSKNRFLIQPLSYKNYANYKLIYYENASKIKKTKELIKERAIITILFALFIAIPFAYIASSPAKKIYQNLYQKSNEITKLANNLEAKVNDEIEKNLSKDRILENQAKLAALGEMLGNIAHQWRHPITRVSLILQNIKTFKSLGKLSDAQLEKYISNALSQMDYMSETIDDFKDFYKPDSQSSIFTAQKAILNANKIVEASIKHQGIQIFTQIKDDFSIKGFQNQFSQVILNIIHNAKDALEENYISSPFIKITLQNKDGDTNQITVEDNAGGIKTDKIDKVFDAYFTTKNESGTGIGLYMSNMIIKDNFKGTISAKNSSTGAIFTIELPIVKI